jgi:hypothetical protein
LESEGGRSKVWAVGYAGADERKNLKVVAIVEGVLVHGDRLSAGVRREKKSPP